LPFGIYAIDGNAEKPESLSASPLTHSIFKFPKALAVVGHESEAAEGSGNCYALSAWGPALLNSL
jgi:hypothetical protein